MDKFYHYPGIGIYQIVDIFAPLEGTDSDAQAHIKFINLSNKKQPLEALENNTIRS